ncbi:hypothetical protein GGI18_000595 [Coemansia linderi]|uniref:Uncharacterized protein n=1 Tax=Coemansia linderi TaxID=2663919 RepID=A0ACC1KMW6_9FUNG|nr:hypothetical protein GGI18_000595 [Coemansia linderi]
MNLTGLSYMQFLLVDAFVCIYLFLRIHETGNWAGINPVSVLRLSGSKRNEQVVRLLGFFSCVTATALSIAKDAIMSTQEFDDVNLCRVSVYMQQPVTPLNDSQLPGIKTGLLLWDFSSGLHLLAMGCALWGWARQSGVLNSGRLLMAWGVFGLVVAISVHFGVHRGDDAARARSVSRLVTSALFFVTLAPLVWIIARVRGILRQANRPMAMGVSKMQVLAFTNDSAVQLAVLLFARSLTLVIFDISFLTPQQAVVQILSTSSVLVGIGTLAASLVSACIVNVMFPRRLTYLDGVCAKFSEVKSHDARIAFPESVGSQGGRTFNGDGSVSRKSRSRAPTTASLAVEKFLPRSISHDDSKQDVANYLEQIPYIDRNARENSYFAVGPWTQPVTRVLSPNDPPKDRSSQPSAQPLPPAGSASAAIGDNRVSVFSDRGSALVPPNESWVSQQVISAYASMSNSNLAPGSQSLNDSGLTNGALSNDTSGPSLHAEPLDDGEGRPDSIALPPMRPESNMPMFRNVLKPERTASFVSDDYQYEPQHLSRNNPFEAHSSPLALRPAQTTVYIASPVGSEAGEGSEEADDGLGSKMQEGPVLIHRGSKASLRRKNTVERRKRLENSGATEQSRVANSANSSQSSVSAKQEAAGDKLAAKKSRMSAFTSKIAPLTIVPSDHQLPLETQRDSSTISTISWGNRIKLESGAPIDAHRLPGALGDSQKAVRQLAPASPVMSFKNSFSSIRSSQDRDLFMSLSSMHTANDAFFTPESSMAQLPGDMSDLRPATAPGRNQQRHTLAASDVTTSEEKQGSGDFLRRVQTLRRAMDTDAAAIESSIQAPTEEETTGALISALPTPNHASPGERVLL